MAAVITERIDGPTPNGGAYAEAIIVARQVVEIVEYDRRAHATARTYCAARTDRLEAGYEMEWAQGAQGSPEH